MYESGFSWPLTTSAIVWFSISEQHDEWQVSKRYFNAESLATETGKFEEIPFSLAAAR
jgi:hypothetical protein